MTNRDLTTRVYRIDKVVYPYGSTTIYLVGFDRHAAVKYCEAHTDASKEI